MVKLDITEDQEESLRDFFSGIKITHESGKDRTIAIIREEGQLKIVFH